LKKEKEREKDNKLREEYNNLVENQEKKRQEEWNLREKRIQSLVNKMADTVVKRNNEIEKDLESKVIKYQLEKETIESKKEQLKKEKLKKKHEEISNTL
jgi:hypothetical protein